MGAGGRVGPPPPPLGKKRQRFWEMASAPTPPRWAACLTFWQKLRQPISAVLPRLGSLARKDQPAAMADASAEGLSVFVRQLQPGVIS